MNYIAMVCALMVVTGYPYSQVNALENSDVTQSLGITDYKVVTENLKSIHEEVESKNFTEEQANALFVSAANLETGTAEMSKMEFSSQIPDFAPRRLELTSLKSTFALGKDESSRSGYEESGIGYEVLSKSGYNKTTSFLTVGNCNVNDPQGREGYMFNTIYSNGKYQDIGIGYFGGKFQGSYTTTTSPIPPSGSGVNFNRQITLVDPLKKSPTSGLYLSNASFSQSYLYNNSVTQIFSDTNVDATRKGKFGCTWANVSKVTINSKTNWHSENISLSMK